MVDGPAEKKMTVADLIKGLPKSSKKAAMPGSIEAYLDEICPIPGCGKKLRLMKPCCGSPYGKKECACGYKVNIPSNSR